MTRLAAAAEGMLVALGAVALCVVMMSCVAWLAG